MVQNIFLGKILLSIATALYGFIPPIIDFNSSHATHPDWPGHARFHVVWQVFITFSISIFAQYLIWNTAPNLNYAFILGSIVLVSFFINTLVMKLYNGTLADTGGVKKIVKIDANLFFFLFDFVLLLIAYTLLHSK
jgi:hypothetical protein